MGFTDSGESGNFNVSMPVQPMYGGYQQPPMYYPAYGYGGNGNDNNDWLILFIILAMSGNWGGFGGFGGGAGAAVGAAGMMDSMMMWPWLMSQSVDSDVQDGFNHASTQRSIEGLRDAVGNGFTETALGIAGLGRDICQTGFGITAAVNGAQNSITQQMYMNQIADLERSYAAQTAQTGQMNGIQKSIDYNGQENRAATADLKYTVASEACTGRYEAAQNTRDIIDAYRTGNQAIMDKLCALELDGYKTRLDAANREIDRLERESTLAAMRESQANQNALFQQGMTNEVDALYNRLKNCPVGTYNVCNPTTPIGCGCGNGGF